MLRNFLTSFTAILMLCSCSISLKSKKIQYNTSKETFEYKFNKKNALVLRNNEKELVDSNNIKGFIQELEGNKNRYPKYSQSEKDFVLKNSDFYIVTLYNKACLNLAKGNYQESLNELSQIEMLYKDINFFSDNLFLKGYAFESLKMNDSAQYCYNKFVIYSSQKFSSRFRGNRNIDLRDTCYINEREYSKQFLTNSKTTYIPQFDTITPKYYFGSFQPGYSFNSGDNPSYLKAVIALYLGMDFAEDISLGVQSYYKINDIICLNPRISTSPNFTEFSFATPLQLYKSYNNNLGIKFTPFITYLNVDSLKIDDNKIPVEEVLLNFGGRASVGYYPFQRLSIGGYYQYNFYNQQNKYETKDNLYLWYNNEYDISLYYNIYKDVSVKVGIKNDEIVAGIFLNGFEMSYCISDPGLILRFEMY